MSDIIIKTDNKEEPQGVQENKIKDILRDADEYQKLKEANDGLEKEYQRREELKAKMALGGRAQAGSQVQEKTQEEKDAEEAKKIISVFR